MGMAYPIFFSPPTSLHRTHHHLITSTAPLTPHPNLKSSHLIKAFSNSTTTIDTSTTTSTDESAKIGSRVKVTGPLKVYHIPKLPEFDLHGTIGVLKQYVGVWKGKRISANLPYKVEFFTEIEGRSGPVKFFAHLKQDEFEFL